MQLERGIDAIIELIVLAPFAILMIPLMIWDEIRDRKINKEHSSRNNQYK